MSNQQIAKLLKNVAYSYIIKDEKKFRFQIIAYQKASETIANLTEELRDYFLEGKLEELPGIGTTLKSHLIELFKTGKAKQFDWAFKDVPESVFILTEIPSIGPKKAYKLVITLGLSDPKTVINKLEKAAQGNKIAPIDGFGEKSQADIIRAIEEFRLGTGKTTRMILPYAFEVSEKIISYLKINKFVENAQALGSLRRRLPTVGDIDIAVATNSPKLVIEHFLKYPGLERIIEKGDVSASILVSGGRQIDLLTQPPEGFGALLVHFTGSKNHNIKLRELALKKQLSVSEYGIKNLKNNAMQKYANENDFYKALSLNFIPPEIREDQGEIELSRNNNLPKLVNLTDLKGDFHLHSNFPIEPSHDLGTSSMEEIITKAKELNYEYIGFSEHNPSISKHSQSQIYDLIAKRNTKIEQLKSSVKNVRVFKLLEVDILPNGKLAIDDKSLSLLDGAIVSIHSSFEMNKQVMTDRVLNGLSNPKAKILAHPTGRMLNERKGFDLDWNKIFEFCKNNNKALEINSWPKRLDLTDTIVKLAVARGVALVIDSDSHNVNQMNGQGYGIFMARRGYATRHDIINALAYNTVKDWFNK